MVHDVEENIVEQGVFWDVVVQLQTFVDHRVGQVILEVKQAACMKPQIILRIGARNFRVLRSSKNLLWLG